MAVTIAVSGKGGSGKTTIASMLVRVLLERTERASILCVDADPNSCLGIALGVPPGVAVADIREQARTKPANSGGMDRVRTFEYGLHEAIVEAGQFDLVTMGRPEGPSCYCAVNSLLRRILDELSSKYQYVVIDNEAGMEHLSRRTTNHVDLLCIVAEPTPVGSLTARRIFDLSRQLPIVVRRTGVLWNKDGGDHHLEEGLEAVEVLARVPEDALVVEASKRGDNVFKLPGESPALQTVRTMVESLFSTAFVKQR
jgi:CO dehydrogenase maturation factor